MGFLGPFLGGTWPPRVGSKAQTWPMGFREEERRTIRGDRGQGGCEHKRKAGRFLGHS